ncbi:hypothetical protein ACQ4LD_20745, partial [Sphingobacterium daejeonense]
RIPDAWERKRVGWGMYRRIGREGGREALKVALRNTKDTKGLIHHSDRGIQYCSKEYTRLLKNKKGKRRRKAEEDTHLTLPTKLL